MLKFFYIYMSRLGRMTRLHCRVNSGHLFFKRIQNFSFYSLLILPTGEAVARVQKWGKAAHVYSILYGKCISNTFVTRRAKPQKTHKIYKFLVGFKESRNRLQICKRVRNYASRSQLQMPTRLYNQNWEPFLSVSFARRS